MGLQLVVLPILFASEMVTVGVTEVAEALLQLRVTVVGFKTPPKMPVVLVTVGLKVPKSSDGAVTVQETFFFVRVSGVCVLV
jgi:hypothetical protein